MPNTDALKRGGSKGRPKGSKSKVTVEVRELAQKLVTDPTYLKNLRTRLITGDLPPAVENSLWFYAYGKHRERLELNVADQRTVIRVFTTPTSEKPATAEQIPKHLAAPRLSRSWTHRSSLQDQSFGFWISRLRNRQ